MSEEKLTQEEIENILAEHDKWIKSNLKEGKRADFKDKNLQFAKFNNANLEMAIFQKADLSCASFISVNLAHANFNEANLTQTNFALSNLEGASLWGANFFKSNLNDVDLQATKLNFASFEEASLQNIKFRGAQFQETNFRKANIESTDFSGSMAWGTVRFEEATIKKTNFGGAIDKLSFEGARLIETTGTDLRYPQTSLFKQEIEKNEQTIKELQEELSQTKKNAEGSKDKIKSLRDKITTLQKSNNDLQQKITEILKNRINLAKESLEEALKNTDEQIQSNRQSAEELGKITKVVLVFVALALFIIPVYIWLSENLPDNNWHIVFYTFPILTLMLIATTLLRHQKALLNEVRHFSMMKHQIELYSGLLEASQHAAASMGDPEKANEYVQETFTQIRNRLLSEQIRQDYHQPLEGKEEDLGSDKIINLLDKITNLANKRPS